MLHFFKLPKFCPQEFLGLTLVFKNFQPCAPRVENFKKSTNLFLDTDTPRGPWVENLPQMKFMGPMDFMGPINFYGSH